MRIIKRKTLKDFWTKHTDCEQQLKAWFKEAEKAQWNRPEDIKRNYSTASFLEGNRVVFHIQGNDYRLVVRINYSCGTIWIRFMDTHADYDKINALEV